MNLIPSREPAESQSRLDIGVLHGPELNVKAFSLHLSPRF
jgi:hypothetical protein